MSASRFSENSPDLARAMGAVARELLGEPNQGLSSKEELRFGSRGSIVVNLKAGTFFDHEDAAGGGVLDLVERKRRTDRAGALAWLKERKHIGRPRKPEIVASYPYTGRDGALLFEVVRFEPKDFRQRRPDGAGGWLWKMTGVTRVLYRLPAVLAAVGAGQRVYIVEGEKAADTLSSLGVVATCSPGGANKWRDDYASALVGAEVVLLPDNDPPGREHAAMVASSLRKPAHRAASLRLLNLPGLPDKGDVADWIAAGGTAAELERLTKHADEPSHAEKQPSGETGTAPKAERPKRQAREPTSRPLIRITAGELHTMTDAAEAALIGAGAAVYQRGNSLVRPVMREVAASGGRTTTAAALADLVPATVMDLLCNVAEWEKFDARADDWVRANPPKMVAEILLARVGFWRVPVVVGVVTTPTLRPDGSLLSAPGYDAATRLYHAADSALVLHPSAHKPTRAHAEAALELLDGLLDGFPFVDTVSRAVALSALITPVVRGAIPVAPLHLFRAPTAGSGKSYLADVVSILATGRLCPVITAAPDEAETEKRLVGLLLAGFPLVSLDNVKGELGGDLLCQLIERQFIRVRALGRSDIVEIESRATALATGNNARVRGDMVRRTLVADLDAGVERPELREFASDPVATILAGRSRYVSACLIVVRAYLLAELPGRLSPVASFSEWSGLVRSALVWLECADPAESMRQAREDDPELGQLREVLSAWREAFGADAVTVRQAIDTAVTPIAQADEYGDVHHHGGPTALPYPALKDALLQVAGVRGVVEARKLGVWLNARKNRPIGKDCFKRGPDTRTATATWMIGSAAR